MNPANIIGAIGVTLLLLAFILNLTRILNEKSFAYTFLNFSGAGAACLSSVLIGFIPFIILEGVWSIAALIAMIKICFRRKN